MSLFAFLLSFDDTKSHRASWYTNIMPAAQYSQKTVRKVQGRTARHKNVRYHNDASLFPDAVKKCLVCDQAFENRKRWSKRGQFAQVKYCSSKCRREARRLGIAEGIS